MSSKIQIVGEIYTRNGVEYPVLDEYDVTGGYNQLLIQPKELIYLHLEEKKGCWSKK